MRCVYHSIHHACFLFFFIQERRRTRKKYRKNKKIQKQEKFELPILSYRLTLILEMTIDHLFKRKSLYLCVLSISIPMLKPPSFTHAWQSAGRRIGNRQREREAEPLPLNHGIHFYYSQQYSSRKSLAYNSTIHLISMCYSNASLCFHKQTIKTNLAPFQQLAC